MGWLFTQGARRKDIIEDRIATETYQGKTSTCLAHCTRGNVLWTVREITQVDGSTIRYIGCDLLRNDRGFGWGYKDMDESVEPYYYTCPLKYLKMTPVVKQAWRDKVHAYHAKRKAQRDYAKTLKVGDIVELVDCSISLVQIYALHPLRGHTGHTRYRIPTKYLPIG